MHREKIEKRAETLSNQKKWLFSCDGSLGVTAGVSNCVREKCKHFSVNYSLVLWELVGEDLGVEVLECGVGNMCQRGPICFSHLRSGAIVI